MNLILSIKDTIDKNRFNIFYLVRYIPYKYKLGTNYIKYSKLVKSFNNSSADERKEQIFKRINKLVRYSYQNILYYKKFYDENNFSVDSLKYFDDIQKIPILKKADLRKFDLSERTKKKKNDFIINTGGSTGQPLGFYANNKLFANEWVHMELGWNRIQYKFNVPRISFRGKNLKNEPIHFNPIHNEYIVNSYVDVKKIIPILNKIIKAEKHFFLHGYPSEIYSFIKTLNEIDTFCLNQLKAKNLGVLLGSEFPTPLYRDFIEKMLECQTLSWYLKTAIETAKSLLY